jgi:hypothetical protein
MLSDIGVIECYSAFARKVRTGDITEEEFRATIKELAEDIRNLRTLDAMQLAVVKRLGTQVIRDVYCADRPLIDLITAEGFSVINPEASPETRQVRGE